jgi:hypothetical protein
MFAEDLISFEVNAAFAERRIRANGTMVSLPDSWERAAHVSYVYHVNQAGIW